MLTGVQGGRTRRVATNRQNPATHIRVFRLGVCGLGCWKKGKGMEGNTGKKKRKSERKEKEKSKRKKEKKRKKKRHNWERRVIRHEN